MYFLATIRAYNEQFKALTPEQWDELRLAIPQLPAEKPTWSTQEVLINDEAIKILVKYKLELELSEKDTTGTMFVKLQDQLDKLEGKTHDLAALINTKAAVQIAIPDLGLMLIDEVTYLENACTDAVQGMLDDRWRILAVCPPNAQRRPDYIFGRRKRA